MRNYLAYPRFLLNMDLGETAKLIYIILLDRARIACRKDPSADRDGNVFIIYDKADLAACSGKSLSTIKSALRTLENAGLVYREEQIEGRPRRIYVKLAEGASRAGNYPPPGVENDPLPGPYSAHPEGEELPLYYNKYKNNIYKTNTVKDYSFEEGESL